jgi:hypothetical protein
VTPGRWDGVRHVDLHFVATHGLSSWAIARWGVAEPEFSHVDILLPDGRLLGARDDYVGDIPPGVAIRPAKYRAWTRAKTVRFDCSPHDAYTALSWAYAERGKKYDQCAIFGFLLGKGWHTTGHFICSALACLYLEKARVVAKPFVQPRTISPNTLYAMAGAAGGYLV